MKYTKEDLMELQKKTPEGIPEIRDELLLQLCIDIKLIGDVLLRILTVVAPKPGG
jgi:hypothetical protein